MKLLLAVALAAIALSQTGCVGSAIRAQTNQSNCEAYGYQRGTEAFANCMLQLETAAQRRAQNDAITTAIGMNMIRNSVYTVPSTMRTCTYRPAGGTLIQNCM